MSGHLLRPSWTRRDLLKTFGVAGAAFASAPFLAACGVGSDDSSEGGSASDDVSGTFDWKSADGTTLSVLQTPHLYQQSFQPLLAEFSELTGIEVKADLVAEADYFTKLNTELAGGGGNYDVFMTGAYFIWQYAPAGWMEDLTPWIENESATNPEYDFEDFFEGLRTSTRWDFTNGSGLGAGGQWAIPWGFETNVIAYNKRIFDERGVKPAETFDELIELAAALTDRSADRYGIATRGSRSWATIHPGFMTQFSREGGKDFVLEGDTLKAVMNTPEAAEFTGKWAKMNKDSGAPSWTTYDYTQATADLGAGNAAMVYDADSATYPKNRPGASAEAGNLAWHPGPAGPDGSYATNLWTWALAMNSASKKKQAAWLFLQWATGKEAMSKAAEVGFSDPTRQSVFDGTFKAQLNGFPGYQEAFERVIGETKILFTPQDQFFDTTEDWAVALQEIYAGQDSQSRLDALVETINDKVGG